MYTTLGVLIKLFVNAYGIKCIRFNWTNEKVALDFTHKSKQTLPTAFWKEKKMFLFQINKNSNENLLMGWKKGKKRKQDEKIKRNSHA